MTKDLLGEKPLRRQPLALMHVADAGSGMIQSRCRKCGHDTGWVKMVGSVSDNKRGKACTRCNTDRAAVVAHYGWIHGGDCPGFWFHNETWGSWKAAASWAGTNQAPEGDGDHPAIYDTLEALWDAEFAQ